MMSSRELVWWASPAGGRARCCTSTLVGEGKQAPETWLGSLWAAAICPFFQPSRLLQGSLPSAGETSHVWCSPSRSSQPRSLWPRAACPRVRDPTFPPVSFSGFSWPFPSRREGWASDTRVWHILPCFQPEWSPAI